MIIADASLILKALIVEADSAAALAVLDAADEVVAPALLFAEVANVLSKKARGGALPREQLSEAVRHLVRALDRVIADQELIGDAFELSIRLNHSAYDCFYLAAARRLNGLLITADDVFRRKCDAAGMIGTVLSPGDWLATHTRKV